MAESNGKCVINEFLKMFVLFYVSTSSVWEFSFSLSSSTLVLFSLFNLRCFDSYTLIFHCGFNLPFLTVNNVENALICLFYIHVSFSFIGLQYGFSDLISLISTLIFISFLCLFWRDGGFGDWGGKQLTRSKPRVSGFVYPSYKTTYSTVKSSIYI